MKRCGLAAVVLLTLAGFGNRYGASAVTPNEAAQAALEAGDAA